MDWHPETQADDKGRREGGKEEDLTDRVMLPRPMDRMDARRFTVFVPDGFAPPTALTITPETGEVFRLEPLGVEHNERDHRAWMSSIDHIHNTPGFAGRRWPHPMTLDGNATDLAEHADDFAARRGFTYTVLDDNDDVIGCVYIYPDDDAYEAHVRSWVRADRARLDAVLRTSVAQWLQAAWPFTAIRYEGVAL